MAELDRVRDVVSHPRAARLFPIRSRIDGLHGVWEGVTGGIRFPSGVPGAIARGEDAPTVDDARAMPDQAGDRTDRAALSNDDPPPFRRDVPDISERQGHQFTRIQLVVRLLRFAGDAIEQVVDDEAVRARLGSGTEVTGALVNHLPSRRRRESVGIASA